MKIAISSSGQDLAAQLDPRFGRCRFFLIIETDTMGFEVFDNENAALGGGAGIQSAQFIAAKGAKAVITGHCGPNAIQALSAAGVGVYLGQTGTVQRLVDKFKNGWLSPTTKANASAHAGTGGKGMGPGQGTGRGRGMGGRGMGGRGAGGRGAR
ncbi:MAG: NifB/NifX family molybdenum-iron cluster-binding protein [Desulfobacterales bacterium]